MKERHKVVPASFLLVRRENELLLMLRKNTSYYDGWWSLPSGHVEASEFPSIAMIREAKEEIGIYVAPEDMHFAHAMFREKHDENGERADYFFETTHWQGEPTNAEPEKCAEIRWFSLDALPENVVHCVRTGIEMIQKQIPYSELPIDPLYR